jgi:molecular chaperone GrpE
MDDQKTTVPTANPDPRDEQIAALEAQIKDLLQKLQQMTDLAARSQADLQNARIRMQRDSDDLRKFAAEQFMQKLLPTIDNFQRAAAHLPADLTGHEWVKGMLATEKELIRQFQELGLTRMDALGKQVDTARHDVVSVAPGKEGEIVQVVEEGYELHGKIIRPAKVIVGAGEGSK